MIARSALAALAGVLIAWSASASAQSAPDPKPHGIKGEDDRVLVNPMEYPWSAIGRLNKRSGGHCTGVLVGRNLVATAAHCLWNERTRRFLEPESVHFAAGYRGGESVDHAPGERFYIPKEYEPGGRTSKALNSAHDWALVILGKDVGRTAGWLGVARVDRERLRGLKKSGAAFVQAGYATDKKQVLTAHIGCALEGFAKDVDLIAHDCDAVAGDSGSPIFIADGDSYRVVAIHVATATSTAFPWGAAVPVAAFHDGVRELGYGDAQPPPAGTLLPVETTRLLLQKLGRDSDADPGAAIRAFERARGLEATGTASHRLLVELLKAQR